jgi:hypothetical protein
MTDIQDQNAFTNRPSTDTNANDFSGRTRKQSDFQMSNNVGFGQSTWTEQQLRNLIKDEMNNNYRSGNPQVPPHQHNGNDNLKINQQNIVQNVKVSGSVTFSQSGIYEFGGLTFNPTAVQFYGIAHAGYYRFTVSFARNYVFTLSAPDTVYMGATYTNNSQTFTVKSDIIGGLFLTTTGTGAPTATGTLIKASGSGGTPLIFTAVATPANATSGATYNFNGQIYKVVTTVTGGSTLDVYGDEPKASSGVLSKISGLGDSTIPFSNYGTTITVRANCIGNAQIGETFYFQPDTSTSVKVGGTKQKIIQSSSMFLVDSNTEPATGVPIVRAITDEGHLVDVEYGGIKARITILCSEKTGYTNLALTKNNSLLLEVTVADGWVIVGNVIIT